MERQVCSRIMEAYDRYAAVYDAEEVVFWDNLSRGSAWFHRTLQERSAG